MKAIEKDLQKKTGLSSIHFGKDGKLAYDKSEKANGGSADMRAQITSAIDSTTTIFKLGDFSGTNVAFGETQPRSRVNGVWTFDIRIDFADFKNAADYSDTRVMDAFSLGMVIAHEIDHNFPVGTEADEGADGVIAHINRMQTQLGLPTRDSGSHKGVCDKGNCSISFHDKDNHQLLLKWKLEGVR